MTVLHKDSTTPRALVFAFAEDAELNSVLTKYGVEFDGVSDPKEFLSQLNKGRHVLYFLVIDASQIKVISALLKSIRKVLGVALPIYAILDLNDGALSPDLLEGAVRDALRRGLVRDQQLRSADLSRTAHERLRTAVEAAERVEAA